LIYQHASAEADRAIADALSGLVDELRRKRTKKDTKQDEDDEGEDGSVDVLSPVG
jgi:hypothetical protein